MKDAGLCASETYRSPAAVTASRTGRLGPSAVMWSRCARCRVFKSGCPYHARGGGAAGGVVEDAVAIRIRDVEAARAIGATAYGNSRLLALTPPFCRRWW